VLSEKLGDLYYAMGKPSSAVESYENCVKSTESRLQRVRVRQYLANVLTEENKTREAVDDLKALLQEFPDYPGKGNVEKRIQDLSAKPADKTASATH
jgi:tetratricopeptide (TPR) repeat protein